MEQQLLNSISAAMSQSSSSESLFFMNYQFDGRDSPRSMQDTMDRRHTAAMLSDYLDDSAKQAQALRQENVNLKMVNAELTTRLSLLIRTASEYDALGMSGSGLGLDSVMGGLTRMNLADGSKSWSDGAESSPSPTSVMDSGRVEGNKDRVVLPKSISVRSTGYWNSGQVAAGGDGGSSNAVGVGFRKVQGNSKISNDAQKVYVRGGKKEDKQALELEVYNQGMFKTELCNKWQETGTCPYGDNCQFAHGIQELRPVLRHPRYKTEVCRMMLNGDHCPYGHRCHFRHSLTDQEKLVRCINLRGMPF